MKPSYKEFRDILDEIESDIEPGTAGNGMDSIYDLHLNEKLNIKEFKEMTEEWLDFIIDCRSGKSHNYDIVIGAMADDQIYNYMDGVITREQFWVLAKFRYPTHQIVFYSDSALQCLKYRDCEVL